MAVNLLQMAVDTYPHIRRPANPRIPVLSIVPDQVYREWFPSDDIYETLRHEVVGVRVAVPPKSPSKDEEGGNESKNVGLPETPASGSGGFPIMDVDGKCLN